MNNETIIFSSGNPGKIKEVQSIFKDFEFSIVPQSNIGIQKSAEETACTFVENALLKARYVASKTDHSVIAEDSGLVIDLLDNEPGVFSARYAGENSTDQENINKVLENLKQKNLNQSPAKFIAVVVYISNPNDPIPIIKHGEIIGTVSSKCSGTNGFGYDPIFYPDGSTKTLAEIAPEIKNSISHRGIAFRALLDILK